MPKDKEFIVAEISKNWVEGEAVPGSPVRAINVEFENVIEVNRRRGYRLHSFELHRLMTAPGVMNETIIAVFELEQREGRVFRSVPRPSPQQTIG